VTCDTTQTTDEISVFSPLIELTDRLRSLLPRIKSLAELKVLLCILSEFVRAGQSPVPITLDVLQMATGLSRQAVVDGLNRAMNNDLVRRQIVRGVNEYQVNILSGIKSRLPCMFNIHDKQNIEHCLYEHVHVCESLSRQQVLRVLIEEFEVSSRVARDIVERNDPELISRQIQYARYDIARGGINRKAGYIVARIRDNWGPPPEFSAANAAQPEPKRWYTDEEYEAYFLHPDE
jgi:hypothetical protein